MLDISKVTVSAESPLSKDSTILIKKLTEELHSRYSDNGEDGANGFKATDVTVPRSVFIVARLDGRPVACGALRPKTDDVAEVKRMYTEPDVRGRGVARRVLSALEKQARDFGYETIVLETGVRQPEALKVYEAMGYKRIDCYDEFANSELSVCFEKKIL
jgi:putative acetyltransferase